MNENIWIKYVDRLGNILAFYPLIIKENSLIYVLKSLSSLALPPKNAVKAYLSYGPRGEILYEIDNMVAIGAEKRKEQISNDKPRIFITSDHHFGHKNIIQYENRPFSSLEKMDNFMIKSWNAMVKKQDKVFHLGDFSFYNKEKTKNIVSQLNGYKHLIMGNHDKSHSRQWWLDCGFDEVSEYPIIYNNFYFFSHEPLYMNNQMPYVNYHGHHHSLSFDSDKFINVSVECFNYGLLLFDK